mmetsp:Transcript_24849/g.37765  ORF Transcript_24849/g.37765 Transcript_24849/m.37765 type:complete len:82 (+) Transcript_24849:213-458(+)
MGCQQSKSEQAPPARGGGLQNFVGLDTDFAKAFLAKHRKTKKVKTEDRHGRKKVMLVGDYPMTWDELVHAMKGAETDELGR